MAASAHKRTAGRAKNTTATQPMEEPSPSVRDPTGEVLWQSPAVGDVDEPDDGPHGDAVRSVHLEGREATFRRSMTVRAPRSAAR